MLFYVVTAGWNLTSTLTNVHITCSCMHTYMHTHRDMELGLVIPCFWCGYSRVMYNVLQP